MAGSGEAPDFVLCIGDDRSDEDMFESILNTSSPPTAVAPEVFACTVGRKPSKAKYYLDDTDDVVMLLQYLANVSGSNPDPSPNPKRIRIRIPDPPEQFNISCDSLLT